MPHSPDPAGSPPLRHFPSPALPLAGRFQHSGPLWRAPPLLARIFLVFFFDGRSNRIAALCSNRIAALM
jgi:hypothetical protein